MEPIPDSISAWLLICPELRPLFDPNSTEEEFDSALETHISDAVEWLENNANSLHPDSEDSLSTTLAAHLTIKKLLEATRETNNRGHVDITIRVLSSNRKRLGEAKIYDGYGYHKKGIAQLVDRYSTGRERTGYMFCYVKKAKIKDKIRKLCSECDTKKPSGQVGKGKMLSNNKWAFITMHMHHSGEKLRVVHFGVNLYVSR